MRPLRLEVSGFTTFRDTVDVELEDAGYFALVGPTGSGKSSLIDAMMFALYGSIPRLDQRSVAPVISQGKNEARVRLEFAIGEATYTAVRVVRKSGPDRASTTEARLFRGDEVLAGDADGLTKEVERLLGLSFEQFTRCVVLPQGEFARFMTDKPAARQDLLVRLLGLDVYERMAQAANQRAATADVGLSLQRERLERDLAFATDDALAQARTTTAKLESLRARIEADEPALEALREAVRAARTEEQGAARAIEALGTIVVPTNIGRAGSAEAEARTLLETLEAAADAAEAEAAQAEKMLAALPDRVPVQRAIDAHARRESIEKQHAAAGKQVTKLRAGASKATQAAEDAGKAAHAALHALEAARLQHRAHDLARELVAGEPCPVCEQHVSAVPKRRAPADLTTAEKSSATAADAQRAAETKRAEAESALAVQVAMLDGLEQQAAAAREEASAFPDLAAARAHLVAIENSTKDCTAARARATEARTRVTGARKSLAQIAEQTKALRAALGTARDSVADLSPPPLAHDDLAADWAMLAEWAAQRGAQVRADATAARERSAAAEREGTALVESQRRACADAGIEDAAVPRDACIKAIERARGLAERIEIGLEAAKQINEEIGALAETVVVARTLGNHLKASAFEAWVLGAALTTLVEGATQTLLELSNGQYSLKLDKTRNFSVVDHRNANMERSARTLSGGETFLASLALALALSDRLAQLSANSAVRLESIFLDEGFGTLDEETLDTVANALETLSSMNRVVGIVTHRRELAERVPVRFEVRKGPSTSVVEKVLA